ncbi:hypothetical protein NN561_020346 [Cricetulus griseus]
MERGPFKRPSRRSGTGSLSSTSGPVCGTLPRGKLSPDPLPGGFPHARSARPCHGAAAPSYPAVCRLLPALSDLLIFHLTRRFPSSPNPSPRLRLEARLGRGRRHAGLSSMDHAPSPSPEGAPRQAMSEPGPPSWKRAAKGEDAHLC